MERVPSLPRIAYQRVGSGPPLVFLHGVGGNHSNWRRQLATFASDYTCMAWDARGYGESDDGDEAVTIATFAADLLRVLDHAGCELAHLVGLSMGGMIAQQFWQDHPQRVASLALCDSAPGADDGLTAAQRRDFLRTRKAPLEAGFEPRDIAPGVARALLGPTAIPEVAAELVASISSVRKVPYMRALDAVASWGGIGALESIDVPTLVMVGEHDRLTTPDIARRMAARIPQARLVVIADAGHISNVENPLAFNAALAPFLSAVTRGTRP